MELFSEAEFWVGVGLLVFFGLLVFLKVPQKLLGALDGKAASIQAELDEAVRIRQEAQELLTSLKAQRVEAEAQAKAMLAEAEVEAKRLEADAKAKLDEQLTRRAAMAERRIALAEQQAAADVKAAAADLAAEAAEALLSKRLKGKRSDPLVDGAVEQLASKLA
ncbi:F0F1 ATP synthase subunit B [Caulobacter sp. 17J80-11]|uniref:F0F1 ATP synthase subunit B n=1 Tax=Caulobacter sp. 17J80-11 TaxID=2763502 RepID=UPI001653869F|nr:F0F1 ATP synthase subunit B [Caulobacter sp. 17J80-11]MBC6982295.1 F0F1 ATP synthase subunit B [Caulobacter sp. 17J80-11]